MAAEFTSANAAGANNAAAEAPAAGAIDLWSGPGTKHPNLPTRESSAAAAIARQSALIPERAMVCFDG